MQFSQNARKVHPRELAEIPPKVALDDLTQVQGGIPLTLTLNGTRYILT